MAWKREEFLRRGLASVAAAGTVGALGRSPAASAALELNVRDFGAKGDGTTDDLAAIKAAVAAAATKSATVRFPAGKYRIAGPIYWPRGASVSIRGDGLSSTTIVGGAPHDATFVILGTPEKRAANIVISDLTFDLDNVEKANALHYYFVSNLTVGRVRFVNSQHKFVGTSTPRGAPPPTVQDNDHVAFEDCSFEHHRNQLYETVTIHNIDTVSFTRCRWFDVQYTGVLLYQLTEHARFTDCVFDTVLRNTPYYTAEGIIYSLSCNDIRIERCRFVNCDGQGIRGANTSDHGTFGYETVKDLVLDHCTFTRCQSGYEVGGVTGFRDTGSVVEFSKSLGAEITVANYGKASYPPHDILIRDSIFRNNNQGGSFPLLHPGLFVTRKVAGYDLDMRLVNCQFYDDQPRHTQIAAITLDGGDGPPRTFRGVTVQNGRLESYGANAKGMNVLNATLQ
jgi:hypothetical protein